MRGRLVTVLVTARMRDALDAVVWLREQDSLPEPLVTFLVSLEFSVGRENLLDVLGAPAGDEPEPDPGGGES